MDVLFQFNVLSLDFGHPRFNVETLSFLRVRGICTLQRLPGSLGVLISTRLGSNLLRMILLRDPRCTR